MQTMFKKPDFHPEASKRSKAKETSRGTTTRYRMKGSSPFWSAVMAKIGRGSPA